MSKSLKINLIIISVAGLILAGVLNANNVFAAAPAPTGLSATCPPPGTSITLSWTSAPVDQYGNWFLNLVDLTTGTTQFNQMFSSAYRSLPISGISGHTYSWWLQEVDGNPYMYGAKSTGPQVTCALPIPTCTSADTSSCSFWGTCTNGTQTCTGSYTKTPAGCSGGSVSAPTQSCISSCSSFVYSDWSTCSGSTQTRTVLSSTPASCSGGVSPVLSQSCTASCSSFTYSGWSTCSGGTQTRTVLSSTPTSCSGGVSPVLSQSCSVGHPAFTYGVYADNTTGELSGYAWSDSIGWIKFGGLSSFPTGSGTTPQNAQLNSSNKLIGWARACAGTINGDCSTMDSRNDGWDGWISLTGISADGQYPYGVSLNGTDFSGYAWGSDVVGWIDFTGVKLTAAPITDITISLSASSSSIISGGSTMITWSASGADTCTIAANGAAFGSGTSSYKLASNLNTTTDFVAQCNNNGNSATKSISVNVSAVTPPSNPRGPADVCTIDANGVNSCDFIWKNDDICTLDPGEYADSDYTLNCIGPAPDFTPEDPITIFSIHMSTCVASQGTSAEMYTGVSTKWSMTNNHHDTLGNTKWSGSNISSSTKTSGPSLPKIYTTVGKKSITAVSIATRSDSTTYISACYASTTIKINSSSGEI